jgi:putative phosphoesterase
MDTWNSHIGCHDPNEIPDNISAGYSSPYAHFITVISILQYKKYAPNFRSQKMRIGLLSDTHGYLDQKVFEYFAGCDEVWHAGDIGSGEVSDQLEKFKPFKAVYGNIDDSAMQRRYPEDLWFTCEEANVFITHIAGTPSRYNSRVKKILQDKNPDILICGHSHILKVIYDKTFETLFLNPGAAGNQGFHQVRTMLRFEINRKKVLKMEVIELGKRGAI